MHPRAFRAAVVTIGGATISICAHSAAADAIPGLFNTGVDALGVPTTGADPHYLDLTITAPAQIINPANPAWLANSATSRWIWETSSGNPTNVTRTFRTTFDLTGLDPATASITGTWATDNFGQDILINGASTGNTSTGFAFFTAFAINSGFVAGINTLDFVVQDVGVVAGFRVLSISGTASQIPGPAGATLLVAGLAAGARRRRREPAPRFGRQ